MNTRMLRGNEKDVKNFIFLFAYFVEDRKKAFMLMLQILLRSSTFLKNIVQG